MGPGPAPQYAYPSDVPPNAKPSVYDRVALAAELLLKAHLVLDDWTSMPPQPANPSEGPMSIEALADVLLQRAETLCARVEGIRTQVGGRL